MELRIKKMYDDVILPKYSHVEDAAMDVFSREDFILYSKQRHLFKLGFMGAFDPNYVCHVWDRSGLAVHNGVTTLAGVIDAGYRGEYGVVLLNTALLPKEIKKGDKIAQLIFQRVEHPTIIEVDDLSLTDRGLGFGSSGR